MPSATRRRRWICAPLHSCVRAGVGRSPQDFARERRTSAFVCKYFASSEAEAFRRDVLQRHFASVRAEKMDASRSRSREQYWVCTGLRG